MAAKVFSIVYWLYFLFRDAPILKDRNEKEKEVATDLSFDYPYIETIAKLIKRLKVSHTSSKRRMLFQKKIGLSFLLRSA